MPVLSLQDRVGEAIHASPESFRAAGRWFDMVPRFERHRARSQNAMRRDSRIAWMVDNEYAKIADTVAETLNLPFRFPHAISQRDIQRQVERLDEAESLLSHYEAMRIWDWLPFDSDAIRPLRKEHKVLRSRIILLGYWILTCPDEIATQPPLTKLQDWRWGRSDYEGLHLNLDGTWPGFPRRYAFKEIYQKHAAELDAKAALAIDLLRELTAITAKAKVTEDGRNSSSTMDLEPIRSVDHAAKGLEVREVEKQIHPSTQPDEQVKQEPFPPGHFVCPKTGNTFKISSDLQHELFKVIFLSHFPVTYENLALAVQKWRDGYVQDSTIERHVKDLRKCLRSQDDGAAVAERIKINNRTVAYDLASD